MRAVPLFKVYIIFILGHASIVIKLGIFDTTALFKLEINLTMGWHYQCIDK